LGTEDEVSELCESKEDDCEHDKESTEIFLRVSNGVSELSHGLVEADVLEDLQQVSYILARVAPQELDGMFHGTLSGFK